MAQVINTNVASLMVQRNLNNSQADAATAMNRLSSGLRINSAKDDAAGLSIASRFTSQINGMNQAIRNAGDAVSLTATAESALGEISDNLQRVRELAVQASNSTYNAADRAALQTEASQLIAEIDRVANATNFNNISLLDGTFTSQIFQVGADAGDNITIASLTDANTATLGTGTLSSAQVSVAKSTITDLGAQVTGILDVNGTDVGAFVAAQSVDERVGQIIAAVNAVEDTTGVSAYDDGTNLGVCRYDRRHQHRPELPRLVLTTDIGFTAEPAVDWHQRQPEAGRTCGHNNRRYRRSCHGVFVRRRTASFSAC